MVVTTTGGSKLSSLWPGLFEFKAGRTTRRGWEGLEEW